MIKKILPLKGCPVYCGSSLNVEQTLINPLTRDLRDTLLYTNTFHNRDCLIGERLIDNPFP